MRRILQKLRALQEETYVLYLAFKHPRISLLPKIIAGLIVAYIFSPIDLVPDFIPLVGYLDELIVAPLLLSIAFRLIPQPILDECRQFALHNPLRHKLRIWAGAAIILLLWLLATIYVLWWYWRM
ncbi:MAG: DUF1232 domain-containing protein [Negativicutes bacterium]|nr:DUF1232 domain-containing protein [Negativicutes bacterium]